MKYILIHPAQNEKLIAKNEKTAIPKRDYGHSSITINLMKTLLSVHIWSYLPNTICVFSFISAMTPRMRIAIKNISITLSL